jgi:hypothetical protein
MKSRLTLLSGSWRFFDLAIVIAAIIAGCTVWFIPNFMNSPEMKKLVASQNERKQVLRTYQARQAETKKEQEELGLVFLPPPPPAAKPAPGKSGPGKPAPKKDE